MSWRDRREVISEILAEYGYSDWVIIQPNQLNPDANCILCNFKERRITEIAIPDKWFEDPRRCNAIGELITLAIDYSSPAVSHFAIQQLLPLIPGAQSVSDSSGTSPVNTCAATRNRDPFGNIE